MNINKIPIVMAAFGTTSKAVHTYAHMHDHLREVFPVNPIYWAYTSRMVVAQLQKQGRGNFPSPLQVLEEVRSKGAARVVVQSLHVLSGHEFMRLVEEVHRAPLFTAMGLPLLHDPLDFELVAQALADDIQMDDKQAVVLVGHGTDHPCWTAYPALEHILQNYFGQRVFVGVVEGWPDREEIAYKLKQNGFDRVILLPFMLVAGVHFLEDLAGDEDSWKSFLQERGFAVEMQDRGLGQMKSIADIFARHIQDALNMLKT